MTGKISFDVSTLTKDQALAASKRLSNPDAPTRLGDMLSALYVYLNNDVNPSTQNWTINISKREQKILEELQHSAQEKI